MRTKIIAGFPGIGKTECKKLLGERALDSDSSDYSWTMDAHGKTRNPNFPKNYIGHIQNKIGKYEYIFVSTHKEVRDALLDNCIFFYLVYPHHDAKWNYVERYRKRGNPESFIELVAKNWLDWISELHLVGPGCQQVPMVTEFLESELRGLFGGEL